MKQPTLPIAVPVPMPVGWTPETLQRLMAMFHTQPVLAAANGAIDPDLQQRILITKATACLLTLGAPQNPDSDHQLIEIVSNTNAAHTLTATGLFKCGTASVNLATFATFAGASLRLLVYQGKFLVLGANGITFS